MLASKDAKAGRLNFSSLQKHICTWSSMFFLVENTNILPCIEKPQMIRINVIQMDVGPIFHGGQ